MSDTDAFGRQREDDPLAAMGWSSSAAATTAAEIDTSPEANTATGAASPPPPPPPPTPTPTREDLPASPLPYRIPSYGPSPSPLRSANPLRWVRRLIVLGIVLGLGAFVYVAVVPTASDVIDDVEEALDTAEITGGGSSGSSTSKPDVDPPYGLQKRSLILRGNLSPALRDLRKRAGGNIRTLRLAPDRIDLIVVTGSGRMRSFQRRWNGETQMLSDTSAPGLQAAPAVSWSDVNASAPRRIARRMLAGGRPSREINYMVLINAAGIRWSAFRTDGAHFNASASGRSVSRVGG